MRDPQVLLIDLDNTLLGSHQRGLYGSFIYAFITEARNRGLSLWAAFALLRILKQETKRIGSRSTNVERAVNVIRTRYPEQFPNEATVVGLIHAVFVRCRKQFFALEQARPFLDWAKKQGRYRLVLATNPIWPLEIVELRLGWGGMSRSDFEWITHGGIMHAAKPALEYYQETISRLGVDPKDCLMIGDSKKKDLPANQLGIPVFLLDTSVQEDPKREIYVGDLNSLMSRLMGASSP